MGERVNGVHLSLCFVYCLHLFVSRDRKEIFHASRSPCDAFVILEPLCVSLPSITKGMKERTMFSNHSKNNEGKVCRFSADKQRDFHSSSDVATFE